MATITPIKQDCVLKLFPQYRFFFIDYHGGPFEHLIIVDTSKNVSTYPTYWLPDYWDFLIKLFEKSNIKVKTKEEALEATMALDSLVTCTNDECSFEIKETHKGWQAILVSRHVKILEKSFKENEVFCTFDKDGKLAEIHEIHYGTYW